MFVTIFRGIILVSIMASLSGCFSWFNDRDEDLYAGSKRGKSKVAMTKESAARTAGLDGNARFTEAGSSKEEIIYFNFNDSRIKSEFIGTLKQQAEYLKNHPNAKLLLAGHADERGSREYNVALGERRANSAFEMLRLYGVAPKQLRVLSYGQERPLESGHDEVAWSRNRRVELTYEATA